VGQSGVRLASVRLEKQTNGNTVDQDLRSARCVEAGSDEVAHRVGRPACRIRRRKGVRSFCQRLVADPEYRAAFEQRWRSGTLPAAMEALIWAYAIWQTGAERRGDEPRPLAGGANCGRRAARRGPRTWRTQRPASRQRQLVGPVGIPGKRPPDPAARGAARRRVTSRCRAAI